MRPIDWQDFRDFCESRGCRHVRTKGDHYVMNKAGLARPIVIQMKKDLHESVIRTSLRTLGATKEELLAFLSPGHESKAATVGPARPG